MNPKIVAQSGGETYHVFSTSIPNRKFPNGDNWTIFKYPHETKGSLKLRAHKEIHNHFKRNGPDYYRNVHQHFFVFADDFVPAYIYHGRFDKDNNFIEIDQEVEKIWELRGLSFRFGI